MKKKRRHLFYELNKSKFKQKIEKNEIDLLI
jgi:hypothetical protein